MEGTCSYDKSNKNRRKIMTQMRDDEDSLPIVPRAEFGIVAGLVSGIVMILVILFLQIIGLIPIHWFEDLGKITGGSGILVNIAIQGLIIHFSLGIIWGIIFAAAFKRYTETKGLAIAGIMLLITLIILIIIPIPEIGKTLLNLKFISALSLVVSLSISYIAYGTTLGYLGKKYLQHHKIGKWEPGWLRRQLGLKNNQGASLEKMEN
jgi:hypothetical protein